MFTRFRKCGECAQATGIVREGGAHNFRAARLCQDANPLWQFERRARGAE